MLLIVVSAIWFASEILLARIKHSQSQDNITDRGSLKILWITIFISVNSGVFIGLQTFGHLNKFEYLFYWIGILVIVSGLIIRWIAIFTLKKFFTVDVATGKEQKIIKDGIYKYIRHPSYTGSLLSFLGLGLSFENILTIIIIFIPICISFLFRIRVEEKALNAAFGDEYIQYCIKTKRLIPGVF
jgi:protein-S-isoprenylcysteine O-methyltransferase Ste14